MLFNFYVFTCAGEKFDMYPIDRCKEFLSVYAQETSTGSAIRIHRHQDLCYHIYTRKIQKTADAPVIGFALVFNNAYCKDDYSRIFHLFEDIYSWMATWKRFIQLGNNGRLNFTFQKLSEKQTEISQIKQRLQDTIDQAFSKSFATLPAPTYNGNIYHLNLLENTVQPLGTLLQYYDKIRITDNPIPTELEVAGELLRLKTEEYKKLTEAYKQLQKEKTQQTRAAWLLFLLIICLIGGGILWQRNKRNSGEIQSLNSTLVQRDSIIAKKRETIGVLRDSVQGCLQSIEQLRSSLTSMTNINFPLGAPSTDNTSSDNSYIMWLYANNPVKLQSFKVRPANSNSFTLSLYNSSDELIASSSVSASGGSWLTVDVSSAGWILQSGYYYIRISSPNGNSLCWHSSNDEEFRRYSRGPLRITGCCSYDSRNNSDAKSKHEYYQYFYDIRYSLYAGN